MEKNHPCTERRWYGTLVRHLWGDWNIYSNDTALGPAIVERRECQRPNCGKSEFRDLPTQEAQ